MWGCKGKHDLRGVGDKIEILLQILLQLLLQILRQILRQIFLQIFRQIFRQIFCQLGLIDQLFKNEKFNKGKKPQNALK